MMGTSLSSFTTRRTKIWIFLFGRCIFPLLMEQKKWRGETTGINKAGLPVFQEITLTIQEDGGIICICRDIEQRLHNQQQMRRHEKILEQSKSMLIITNKKRTNCNN